MQKNIRHQLDQSVPKDIILDNERKSKIMNEAGHRLEHKELSRPRMFKPLLVGAAITGLSLFLTFPYLQEWSEDRAYQQSNKDSLVAVTIPDVDYPSLIEAEYVDQTNEIIYTDHDTIYSYSIKSKTKNELIEPVEDARIFEFAVNGDWLVWEEISSSTMYVLNRLNNEIKEYPNVNMTDYHLEGDILTIFTFKSLENEVQTPIYKSIDLTTFEEIEILELIGPGSNSEAAISDGTMAIPERIETSDGARTKFFLYDLNQKISRGEYVVPFENAEFVTFTDGKIYSQLSNKLDMSSKLAYIDLKDGRLVEIETPPFDEFAVYQNYVALSVQWKDSNTVKLYQITGKTLKELPTFNHIKERLVRPRFTDEGILVVNGESDEFTMYLQDVNQLD